MPSIPIKHAPQETDAGCLAACAHMILTHLNITISQTELNQLFELTPLGVPLSRFSRLQQHGIQASIRRNGELDDLRLAIDQETPPIVFIRTQQLSYWAEDTQHAVLLSGYDGSDLLIHDPAFPEAPRRVPSDELLLAWDEFDNTYALLHR